MSELINIFEHPLVKKDYRNNRLYGLVALVLLRNQKLLLGTNDPQGKVEKLKAVFPDAEIKITSDCTVEISCQKPIR